MEYLQQDKPGLNVSRRRFLVAGLLMLFSSNMVLQGCTLDTAKPSSLRLRSEVPSRPLQFDVMEGLAKLNEKRVKRFLAGFQLDPRLQNAAQRHADMMGSTGKYGHDIGRGTDFKSRIHAVGFNGSAGENIGVGYGSIDEAIDGWINSPKHKKNMFKSRYTLMGLAYAYNTSGRNDQYSHFWVLIMGSGDRNSPQV